MLYIFSSRRHSRGDEKMNVAQRLCRYMYSIQRQCRFVSAFLSTMASLARETAATATAMLGQAAPEDPPPPPPEDPRLAEKTQDATIRKLQACEVCSGYHARRHLRARRLLEAPCAKSAASALMGIHGVALICDKAARTICFDISHEEARTISAQ